MSEIWRWHCPCGHCVVGKAPDDPMLVAEKTDHQLRCGAKWER